jgi:uncharacterized protein
MATAFSGPEAFVSARPYEFLPFRYIALDDKIVVTNEAGEHELLERPTFDAFVEKRLLRGSQTYEDLRSKHFLIDSDSKTPLTLLSTKVRTKRSFLAGFTGLHIFVVTLRCDHSCHYCQVSRVSINRSRYDMTVESAERALDLVFRSPAPRLKIEFQGGEPLLNYELIQHIVDSARRRNEAEQRDLSFVVTTNLSFLTDEMLAFFKEHGIVVSTSLDGPAFIHNVNRPRPEGDAYDRTIAGISRVREALGHHSVSALMTTTRLSLEHPTEIVDEFVKHDFDHIFLRPLSPYGFAIKTQRKTGYDLAEFIQFYETALGRIIELNRRGYFMVEVYAQILLTKILTPYATGYVDLRSPAGAGIGVAVYNYDGDVYPTDESRMLAQMNDTSFRLGNVHTNTYEEMFGGELLRSIVSASCVESLPGCSDCAFNTYCGADPVENYATQGDLIGHRPSSRFCGRNMKIIKHLLRLYHGPDPFIRRLFWSWVQNAPADELLAKLPE